MEGVLVPKWLEWTMQIQAIAQTGLNYAQNEFAVERYQALRASAAEMMANYSGVELEDIRRFARGE